MAILRPFRAVRPSAEKARAVAALPYDVVDRYEAREIGNHNPDSFLHIDRAEMDLEEGIDIYSPEVYVKARQNLDAMREKKVLIQDKENSFYLYELIRNGKSQTGIVGTASVDEYLDGTIKKHELTREDKEQDRIRHVDACNANTGPIFLAADFPGHLKKFVKDWKTEHAPVYDFAAEDGIIHRVWQVVGENGIRAMIEGCSEIPCFYIADGHHRAASAVKVALKRRNGNPDFTGMEEFNYFLSVVFPYEELTILPYHRIIRDRCGMESSALVSRLEEYFEVTPEASPVRPDRKHAYGMYVQKQWYLLKAKPVLFEGKDVVAGLDVSILQDHVLNPIFGIKDARTDERIRFMGGSHEITDLMQAADDTDGVAFAMFPTQMEDLMNIADNGKLMPPKSTWFEPKLRSGLFIHLLEEES